MQLPQSAAAYDTRVRYGRYVSRRLRKDKRIDLSQSVYEATQNVKQAGRAWEDTVEVIQDALADRDAADDVLDAAAQEARLALASRGISANRESPYIDIFPKGLEYYTAAPLDEEVKRYNELIERLKAHLPEDDPVRQSTIPKVEAGIVAFKEAEKAVEEARTAQSLAATRLARAEDAWNFLMEKIYGLLTSEMGRKRANRFFPKINRSRKKNG